MVVQQFWEPVHGPHQVFVSMSVDSISEVDTVKQSFKTRLTLTCEWMMTAADRKTATKLLEKGTFDQEFVPKWQPPPPQLPNALESEVADPVFTIKQYDEMVMISAKTSVAGTFAEMLELNHFPFDWCVLNGSCVIETREG